MDEFLLENYNNITFSVEILAATTGLLLYKKYKFSAAKFFIWFLVYLSLCEIAGMYVYFIKDDGIFSFLEGTRFARNFWWSTSFWKIGAIVFFAFYYYHILENLLFKSMVKISGIFFFIVSVIHIALHWEDFFTRFFPIISVLGAIVVFLSTVFYFLEILQSERILTFYKSLNFYISVAIFIWWLIITPLVFYDIYHSRWDWNFIFLKWQIYLFSNIFMYLTFTFALIFCKSQKNIE